MPLFQLKNDIVTEDMKSSMIVLRRNWTGAVFVGQVGLVVEDTVEVRDVFGVVDVVEVVDGVEVVEVEVVEVDVVSKFSVIQSM